MPANRTPLYDEHVALGAKMVDFAGWEMPVQYPLGLRGEHNAVRENVGLFDVCHMGEIRVTGPNSLETLQWLTSNDVSKLVAGKAQYTLLTNDDGGVVDDIIVYCIRPSTDYLLCVNASNKAKDLQWIMANNQGAEIEDQSDFWGQIAIQGPASKALMEKAFKDSIDSLNSLKNFEFCGLRFEDVPLIVARTGYTGEFGYEVFVPWEVTPHLWRAFMRAGRTLGVQPAGLGARDTLRTEMGYSLYGHEIGDRTSPYAVRLGWVVKPDAKDFLGKEEILASKENGALKQKLVGFVMQERGIPRQGYKLFSFDNQEIGTVTSGTVSPTLEDNIGLGFVDKDFGAIDSEFLVEIRSRKLKAKVVELPFIKAEAKAKAEDGSDQKTEQGEK